MPLSAHYSAPYAAIQFAGRWGEETGLASVFSFSRTEVLRTACFVDGYNLFYGLLAGTEYKWLDLPALLAHIIRVEHPANTLQSVKFFTTGVIPALASRGRLSKEAQDTYLRALKVCGVEVFFGRHQIEPRNALRFVDKNTPASRADQIEIWKLE